MTENNYKEKTNADFMIMEQSCFIDNLTILQGPGVRLQKVLNQTDAKLQCTDVFTQTLMRKK